MGVCTVLALLAPTARAAGRAVSFRALDGRVINALVTEASQRPAAAVVLVPMLGQSKDGWQDIAQRFADADITALAIDLPQAVLPPDPRALSTWHTDILAAVSYLASRPDVRASAIGVAGASLGANLAAVAASGDPRVRALALVSPSLDYRGVRIEGAMRTYGGRPALLMGSRKDPYAARSMRELAREAPGPRELHWSDRPAHGLVLLAREGDLVQALVGWFRRTLPVN